MKLSQFDSVTIAFADGAFSPSSYTCEHTEGA